MPGASVHVETLAGRTFAVTVTGQGGQVVIADEPDAAGGDDLGPTPYELLLASLGACTAMTLRLYADRKQWPLDGVRLRLSHERVYQTDCDDCATDAGFSLAYTSADDAFPGNPPRPVAPHMILRSFDIPNTRATHLRLVVKTTQCTGGPAFQGDQDLDPAVNADCDSNVAAGASRSFVRAAELQAFSSSSRAD